MAQITLSAEFNDESIEAFALSKGWDKAGFATEYVANYFKNVIVNDIASFSTSELVAQNKVAISQQIINVQNQIEGSINVAIQ